MSDFDRNYAAARPGVGLDRAMIDAGLRAHMIRVYNYMAMGVALTGVVAWVAYLAAGGDALTFSPRGIGGLTPFGQMLYSPVTQIVLFLGTLGMVFFISFRVDRLQASTALLLFMIYAGVLGLALSSIFLVYTHVSITRVFFISAASFGALRQWCYTTQVALWVLGSFLPTGLYGS